MSSGPSMILNYTVVESKKNSRLACLFINIGKMFITVSLELFTHQLATDQIGINYSRDGVYLQYHDNSETRR